MVKVLGTFMIAFAITLLLPLVATYAGGDFYDTEVMTSPNSPANAYTNSEEGLTASDSGPDISNDVDKLAAAGSATSFSADSKPILWILGVILLGLLIWGSYVSWSKHQMRM